MLQDMLRECCRQVEAEVVSYSRNRMEGGQQHERVVLGSEEDKIDSDTIAFVGSLETSFCWHNTSGT